jgi:hypothetical protein
MHTPFRSIVMLGSLIYLACSSADTPIRSDANPAAPPPRDDMNASAALPPLGGTWRVPVADADGYLGEVTLPLGSRHPRGVVVGVHGAVSRADYLCGTLRGVYGEDVFVYCPHAARTAESGASWLSPEQLRSRVVDGVRVLQRRFPGRLDLSSMVFLGHSQGAMLLPAAFGAKALPEGMRFRHVVFFEGLPKSEPAFTERALRNMGAESVYLVSGQSGWRAGHEHLAEHLRKRGLGAVHVHGEFGHWFNDPSERILREQVVPHTRPSS